MAELAVQTGLSGPRVPESAGRPRRPSRLPSLTGLRFIAAAMVFFFHAGFTQNLFSSADFQQRYQTVAFEGGWAGVGFFFVLSGFVLAWSRRPQDTARAFWRRRFFKIYPNHLVTFLAAAVLLAVVAHQPLTRGTAALHLLLLQSWTGQLAVISTGNTVSWSLSCEALFYLSFPLLIRYLVRIRPERLWVWTGGVVAGIFAVPLLAHALPGGPVLPLGGLSLARFWFIYFLPATRLLDFVFGILLARIVLTGRRIPVRLGGAAALAIGAYALSPVLPWPYPLVAVMVVPLGLVIAAGAVADADGQRSFLASPPMVWLGEVSFAFYMCHYLVLTYGHQLLGGHSYSTPLGLGVLALLFGATLLTAWLLYSLVERPIMRRFARPRRRPAPAVVAGPATAMDAPEPSLAG